MLTLVRHQSYGCCMALPPTTTTVLPDERGPMFRAMREGAGLDIRPLAARAEISHSTISRWERGLREISEPTYEHLTLALATYMAGEWSA